MKAPDKIYIGPMLNPSDGYVGIAWAEAHGGMEEYVRKDALLEFVNKKLQESADRLDYRTNKSYAEILDKLNEM